MRKITDEGFLFLYGVGLLVTAETGIPAVIAILLACIYTCVNLVGEEKYLHYIMTITFRGSRNCFQRNVDVSSGVFI